MLKTFGGNTTEKAALAVIDELKARNTQGSQHIVIVPDRMTLAVEVKIFERLGIKAAFNIDVVSFSRLAAKEQKGSQPEFLSKNGTVLLLHKIMREHREELALYGRYAGSISFAKELFAVIAELRDNGYTPADVAGIAGDKFRDIALLYQKYQSTVEAKYRDTSTRLDALTHSIKNSERIRSSDVYLIGFAQFSAKQKEILAELEKYAKSVSVAKCEMRNVKCGMADNKITLARARSIYEEIRVTAQKVKELLSAGARYKDIYILQCDPSSQRITRDVLLSEGIPVNFDVKYPLSHTVLARLIADLPEPIPLEQIKERFCSDDELQATAGYDKYKLDVNLRAAGEIDQLICEIRGLLDTEHMSADEQLSALKESISSAQLSLIPQHLDAVGLGDLEGAPPFGFPYLFVMGATSGALPKTAAAHMILSDRDVDALELSPTRHELYSEQKFMLADLFSRVHNGIFMSYPEYSASGEKNEPSRIFNEVSGEIINSQFTIHNSQLRIPKEKFCSPKMNISTAKVSQLECYFSCPRKHFLRHGLRLKQPEVDEIDHREAGNIIHKALELYFSATQGKIRILTDGELDAQAQSAVAGALVRDSVGAAMTEAKKYIVDTIRRECLTAISVLTDAVKNSDFEPTYFEYPVEMQVGDSILGGRLDRADIYRDKVVLLDYKTGSAAGLGNLDDVYYGTKIQLYAYLKHFCDMGMKPAGVYYVPVGGSAYTSGGRDFRYRGQSDTDIDLVDVVEKVQATVAKALSEISSGYAEARPLDNACKHCEYISLCAESGIKVRTKTK
jgi:ATP-dependent helicase/DNAse subunit B